jgi:hypothetical protein
MIGGFFVYHDLRDEKRLLIDRGMQEPIDSPEKAVTNLSITHVL